MEKSALELMGVSGLIDKINPAGIGQKCACKVSLGGANTVIAGINLEGKTDAREGLKVRKKYRFYNLNALVERRRVRVVRCNRLLLSISR